MSTIWGAYQNKGILLGGDLNVISPNEGIDSAFLALSISNGAAHKELASKAQGKSVVHIHNAEIQALNIAFPSKPEQSRISGYFTNLDHLITLHQCKPNILTGLKNFVWEQRKLGEICSAIGDGLHSAPVYDDKGEYYFINGNNLVDGRILLDSDQTKRVSEEIFSLNDKELDDKTILLSINGTIGNLAYYQGEKVMLGKSAAYLKTASVDKKFLYATLQTSKVLNSFMLSLTGTTIKNLGLEAIKNTIVSVPCQSEQRKIGAYIESLDRLITLHQRKGKLAEKAFRYIKIRLITVKETKNMAELEALIEQKLIDQLAYGDSQWNYRQDLKTEADLWNNFRYILEQNNKDRLNGEPLSDAEFDQVKNQLQFSSFYKAGEWLVGENGKVMVHVQRGTEKLHLVVMNHEHIAGGSSVYEVINQYQALDTDENSTAPARDRRFDVTLLINGLPMIHIELKNKQHPYMDGL